MVTDADKIPPGESGLAGQDGGQAGCTVQEGSRQVLQKFGRIENRI